MLYALRDPLSFVLLLVSFLVALTLHGWVQAVVAARTGLRAPVLEGRTRPDPRRHLDPFGAVAAAVAGYGWAKPVTAPDPRRRGPLLAMLLSGPAVNVVLGLVVLALLPVATGVQVGLLEPSRLLQAGVEIALLPRALLLFGLMNLMVGLLSLVPLPPLDGGRLLFALAPKTLGWQKAAYQLDERNIGTAVLLALLLIPLGGPQALLPTVLDTFAGPLARLVTGG